MPETKITNEQIATEVMGWEYLDVDYYGTPNETPRQVELADWLDKVGVISVGYYYIDVETDFCIPADDHDFLTDHNAAMLVVEKMWGSDRKPVMTILDDGDYYVDFLYVGYKPEDQKVFVTHGKSKSLCVAICEAALKAVRL